jgi:hypothetical protein
MQTVALLGIWIAILAVGLSFLGVGAIWFSDPFSMNYLILGATVTTMGAYAVWLDFLTPGGRGGVED